MNYSIVLYTNFSQQILSKTNTLSLVYFAILHAVIIATIFATDGYTLKCHKYFSYLPVNECWLTVYVYVTYQSSMKVIYKIL